jgi:hypothetical protein
MTANDWVDVTFLWMDAPSPSPRATPRVLPKTPPASARSGQVRSASFNAPTPSNQLYLPLVTADPASWWTTWTIQNPIGSAVTGTTQLYETDGRAILSHTFSLPPFGSSTFSPFDPLLAIPRRFVGSAVISASGPITAVVNEDRAGFDRMSYEAFSTGAAAAVAPIVFKDYKGWSTGLQVQNLASAAASVEIEYVDGDGNTVGAEAGSIAPLASLGFYQPANDDLPASFAGSARVRSDAGQPLAILVHEIRADGSAMAYTAASVGSERLDVPLLFKRYNGWDTGLQLFNVGDTAATVRVTYQTANQPIVDSLTIAPDMAATLYQPANERLPDGYVGSATVVGQAGAQLVGVVNEVRLGAKTSMNYVVGLPSAPLLTVPLVTKNLDGWDSGIQIRNPGATQTRVVVTFYSELGAAIHRLEDVIPAAAARTYYAPAMAQIPAGFRGSAIIQSMTGQPLTAIVNEVSSGDEVGGK